MTLIGVLGIGNLAEYLIRGAEGAPYRFLLAPRSRERAEHLAQTHHAEVAASSQDVLDEADHILLCLPASKGLEILRDLSFRPGHTVLSAMAGVSLADLSRICAPARLTLAMMPGYANVYRAGPSILYPPDPDWQTFLSRLGPVHPLERAEDFDIASGFGALSGASVFLMKHLADWYVARGLAPDLARRLVAETFRGNAEVFLQSPAPSEDITRGVTTPGGITELLLATLARDDALDSWHRALDAVLARMQGQD